MHDSVSACFVPVHCLPRAFDRSMRRCGVGYGGKEYVWNDWFAWVKFLKEVQVVKGLCLHHNGCIDTS